MLVTDQIRQLVPSELLEFAMLDKKGDLNNDEYSRYLQLHKEFPLHVLASCLANALEEMSRLDSQISKLQDRLSDEIANGIYALLKSDPPIRG